MSVKIAFRSAGEVCRSADNMLLTAWFYAALRPAGSVLVQTDKTWRCIYSGGKERILFADCGRSREKKVCNSLKNADVVVVNLTPKKRRWIRFFMKTGILRKKFFILSETASGKRTRLAHTWSISTGFRRNRWVGYLITRRPDRHLPTVRWSVLSGNIETGVFRRGTGAFLRKWKEICFF